MGVGKTISVLLCLVASIVLNAQDVYVGSSTSMFIGASSSFFSGGDLKIAGTLDNQGTLALHSHVDFSGNTAVGDLVFMGKTGQDIRGNTLQARSLKLHATGEVKLQATQLLSSRLHLESGVLQAPNPGSLVILEGQSVTGGSTNSYVEGSLQLQCISPEPLRFPVGLNGNYNEFTLESVMTGSMVEVSAQKPEIELIPGDSLVGLSDEILWKVRQSGDAFNSAVTVAFEGLDMQNVPSYNEIRASSYRPVIARKGEDEFSYSPLGFAQNDGSGERSTGRLTSAQKISINGKPVYLAIGIMPEGGPYFYIPNAFTPGGVYEENQLFRPFLDGAEIRSLNMTIWDQYNNEVYSFSASNVDLEDTGWDGTVNGQESPEALYYYKISMKTSIGDFSENGTVVLLR